MNTKIDIRDMVEFIDDDFNEPTQEEVTRMFDLLEQLIEVSND